MANEFAGSAAYLEWIYSSGTVVLNTDFRTITYTPSMELIDATAGADAYRQSIASFTSVQLTFSGIFPSNGTAQMQALKERTTGTVNYGPAGTATNSPKVSFPAVVGGPAFNEPYADVVEISCTFSLYNGTVTYGAY